MQEFYNQRGECENGMKEFQYDYGIDGFAFQGIAAVDATFRLVMLPFNIMALFMQGAWSPAGRVCTYRPSGSSALQ